MTHDPYQTYPTFGAYSGQMNPFSSPYAGVQTAGINPAAGYNPLATAFTPWAPLVTGAQQLGAAGYGGISPQQLQIAAALASSYGNPWQNQFITGMLQNPLGQAGANNPLLNVMTNPILAQMAASLHHQHQQLGYAIPGAGAQFNNPFVQPLYGAPQMGQPQLAPQSWVGQGVAGQQGQFGGGQGQVHPLFLQAVARAIQGQQGFTPWGTL